MGRCYLQKHNNCLACKSHEVKLHAGGSAVFLQIDRAALLLIISSFALLPRCVIAAVLA
jgi:hypothetical protein